MERFAYVLAGSWTLLAVLGVPGTLVTLIAIVEEGPGVAVIATAVTVGLQALVVRQVLVHEAASRTIALQGSWSYSLWGPSSGEYRIWAPPFTSTGAARSSRRSSSSIVVGGRRAEVERMYLPRDPFHWSGSEYVHLLHLDKAFPTVRLIRNNFAHREVVQPITMSSEFVGFNAMWSVGGNGPEFAHAWLAPQVQEYLIELGELVPRVTLSGAGLFAHGHHEDASNIGAITTLLGRVAAAMPSGVAQKYGSELDPDATIPRTAVDHAIAAIDGPRRVERPATGGPGPSLAVAAAVMALPVPVVGVVLAIAAIASPDSGRRWARILAWIALAVSVASIALGLLNVFVQELRA